MRLSSRSFSSLYIGILAATCIAGDYVIKGIKFQFPLHRDPRCNDKNICDCLQCVQFQFPLHRDPRCNNITIELWFKGKHVSVPFTSGSSLQPSSTNADSPVPKVSVPFTSGSSLQLDVPGYAAILFRVSVPFTSGSSLQPLVKAGVLANDGVSVPFTSGSSLQPDSNLSVGFLAGFSSLYIGILAATGLSATIQAMGYVSVPFTSGSSLQLPVNPERITCTTFQFPLHRDPRCNLDLLFFIFAGLCFSSLYIGILAATNPSRGLNRKYPCVSVPFTSGSSLQRYLEYVPGLGV